jgi:hypothetical protein
MRSRFVWFVVIQKSWTISETAGAPEFEYRDQERNYTHLMQPIRLTILSANAMHCDFERYTCATKSAQSRYRKVH